MKTKAILASVVFTLIAFIAQGQTIFLDDFETWSGNVPSSWMGSKTTLEQDSIMPYSNSAHSGIYSCRLVNNETAHKRFTTQAISITQGSSYNVSFWVRGHGSIRVGLYDGTNYTYNNYIVVNSSAWSLQTQSMIASLSSTSAEFILSIQLTLGDIDDIQVDDVTITTGAVNNVSIYDIQYTTDISGDSPYKNQSVNTMGVVTAKNADGFYLQDGSGAWNGIYIYSITYASTMNIGDVVSLTGTVSEYYNNTQIQNLTECTVVYSGANPPNPSEISATLANTEQYEGVLVQVLNANCIELPNTYGEWKIFDGDTIIIDDFFYPYTPVLNGNYSVTGPIVFYFNLYRILPRSINDIVVNTTNINEFELLNYSVYPNPATNFVNISFSNSSNLPISIEIFTIAGQKIFSFDDITSNSINIDLSNLIKGMYILKVVDNETHQSKLLLQ